MAARFIPDGAVQVPRGFLEPYDDVCKDSRFTIEFRGEIENLCRRILNRQKKIEKEKSEDEANEWFRSTVRGEKGPLHRVSILVRNKVLKISPKTEKFMMILGAYA